MAMLSLRISLEGGRVTKTIQFEPNTSVFDACRLIREKFAESVQGQRKWILFLPLFNGILTQFIQIENSKRIWSVFVGRGKQTGCLVRVRSPTELLLPAQPRCARVPPKVAATARSYVGRGRENHSGG